MTAPAVQRSCPLPVGRTLVIRRATGPLGETAAGGAAPSLSTWGWYTLPSSSRMVKSPGAIGTVPDSVGEGQAEGARCGLRRRVPALDRVVGPDQSGGHPPGGDVDVDGVALDAELGLGCAGFDDPVDGQCRRGQPRGQCPVLRGTAARRQAGDNERAGRSRLEAASAQWWPPFGLVNTSRPKVARPGWAAKPR